MLDSLSIVLPMYNEKDNIRIAVAESIRVGYQIARELEVIVVDDASTDGSGMIVDSLALDHPEVRVIHHAKNQSWAGL